VKKPKNFYVTVVLRKGWRINLAKGAVAKQNVVAKLKEVFKENYIGESSNKHYVWADDGGEKVQIAISLTCPKTPIGTVDMSSAFGDGMDFEAAPVIAQTTFTPAEITPEEEQNLADMMAALGL
jgi:hypothetical protein